jgi:hypothetical protein
MTLPAGKACQKSLAKHDLIWAPGKFWKNWE